MANECAIGWDNRADTALLQANSAANDINLNNLKTDDVRDVWTAATSFAAIKVDFGSQITWGGCALVNSNAVAGDTMVVRLNTTDPLESPGDAYESGTIVVAAGGTSGMLVHFPPAPVVGRHLRIELNQSNFPEAGRLFAGPVWLPSRAFAYGWRPPWRDASVRTESLGQVLYINRKIRQRGMQFSLRGITESEWAEQVNEMNRIVGTSRDILVCKDITSSNLGRVSLWGLQEHPADASQPEQSPEYWAVDFEVWERV